MSLKKAKLAHTAVKNQTMALPINNTHTNKIAAHYNGFSVIINDLQQMKFVNTNGVFGKANLSRNAPQFHLQQPEIIRTRQFNARRKFSDHSIKPLKVLIVPDSEDENEDPFTNLRPQYELDHSGIKETLHLSAEEAYFLMRDVKCINIYDDDVLLDELTAWALFRDDYFVQNYATYYYYRAKNWVVKPSIKFGGDYVLYKDGPQEYHSSFVVIIDVLNVNMTRMKSLARRSMDYLGLLGLNRMCENAGKGLLICQLIYPENLDTSLPNCISKITVKEVLMKRWQGID